MRWLAHVTLVTRLTLPGTEAMRYSISSRFRKLLYMRHTHAPEEPYPRALEAMYTAKNFDRSIYFVI